MLKVVIEILLQVGLAILLRVGLALLELWIIKQFVMDWITEWHKKLGNNKPLKEGSYTVSMENSNMCVMCGEEIPEGALVCKGCRDRVMEEKSEQI